MVDEVSEQRDKAMFCFAEDERAMPQQVVEVKEQDATITELKHALERLTLEAQAMKENARVASIPAERPERPAIIMPQAPVGGAQC